MCQCVCVFKSVFVVVNLYLVLNITSHGKGKDLPPHLGLIKAALKKRSLHSVGLSSYECTREVGRAREKRLIVIRRSRVLLPNRVLSQPPKCIHNSIEAQLKHEPFLLTHDHCHFIQYL